MAINEALQTQLSELVTRGVAENVAPFLIAVVFDKDGELAQAAAGVGNVATGESVTTSTTIWQASMSKAVSSVAALILVERDGFDIDSHDALVDILPELKLGNGLLTSKVFGAKKEDGTFEEHDAKKGITLRHLLSHTSGFAYSFTTDKLAKIYQPEGPLPGIDSGEIRSIIIPRCFEAGEDWMYGVSTDWVGLFIERVSKKSLPQAYQELIFDPLSIDGQTDLSPFISPEMAKSRSVIHAKLGGADSAWTPLPDLSASKAFEGTPPDGYTTFASAPLHGTVPGYAKFARSLLNKTAPSPGGKRLISEKLWEHASADNLGRTGLSLPEYTVKSTLPFLSNDFPSKGSGEGWTLLQTVYNRVKSETGRQPGTLSWAGLANSYFFVDPVSGVGGVIATQILPFGDHSVLKVKEEFEKLIYATLKK